MIEVVDEVY